MILRQRQPRVECRAFLAFVRRRPCCVCGAPAPSQAAHVRRGCEERGERETGKGEKPDDRRCLPLCRWCHLDAPDSQHRVGERAFWARVGLDPFAIAADLYAQFCAVTKVRFRKAIKESVHNLKPVQPVKRRVPFLGKNQVSLKITPVAAGVLKVGDIITSSGPWREKPCRIISVSRPWPQRANPWPPGRKLRSRR